VPRRGIGLELLVLPSRSEGLGARGSAATFSPSEARGERRAHREPPMRKLRLQLEPQAGSDAVQQMVETVEKPQIAQIYAKKVLCFQQLFFQRQTFSTVSLDDALCTP
jgi:hypothetical protein